MSDQDILLSIVKENATWKQHLNWDKTIEADYWTGVEWSSDGKHVISVSLTGFPLTTIPPELIQLKKLRHLVLGHNGFEGRISDTALGDIALTCRDLQAIIVKNNRFVGALSTLPKQGVAVVMDAWNERGPQPKAKPSKVVDEEEVEEDEEEEDAAVVEEEEETKEGEWKEPLVNSEGISVKPGSESRHTKDDKGNDILCSDAYYCGRKMSPSQCRCGSCDGRCGPNNGCPCTSCYELLNARQTHMAKLAESEAWAEPTVNSDGIAVKVGSDTCSQDHVMIPIAAGKKPEGYSGTICDKCGANSLEKNKHINYHCSECQYDICYKCISKVQGEDMNVTDAYYCGRVMDPSQCRCGNCDATCGPTNGCPCTSCLALLHSRKAHIETVKAAAKKRKKDAEDSKKKREEYAAKKKEHEEKEKGRKERNTARDIKRRGVIEKGAIVERGPHWPAEYGKEDIGYLLNCRAYGELLEDTDYSKGAAKVKWTHGGVCTYTYKKDCKHVRPYTGEGNPMVTKPKFVDLTAKYKGKTLPGGCRVKRGVDWKWSNQDHHNGEEVPGTTKRDADWGGWVEVEWDGGSSNSYRWGNEDATDVEVISEP